MSHHCPPRVEADDSASGAVAPVTLISNPWVRLVSTDRGSAPDLVAKPDVHDRAA